MTLVIGAVVLALIAAGLVIHPLIYRQWTLMGDAVPADVADRESRKRTALAALKDVEYDHAAGKLDDDDYRDMRGRLELEALEALRASERSEAANRGALAAVAHACGFGNPPGSRFCAGCGKRLARA